MVEDLLGLPWRQLECLTDMDRTEAGVSLVQRGWRIVPLWGIHNGQCRCANGERCLHPGKHPSNLHGTTLASMREHTVRLWAAEHTLPGWGLLMGARGCGMWALDIDARNGGEDSLRRLIEDHGTLPPTLTAYSLRGGPRFLFEVPAGRTARTGCLDGYPGIDILGDGSQLVLVQTDRATGQATHIDASHTPVRAPTWLEKLVIRDRPPEPTDIEARTRLVVQQTIDKAVEEIRVLTPGTRHNGMIRSIRDVGGWVDAPAGDGVALTEPEAMAALMPAVEQTGLVTEEGRERVEAFVRGQLLTHRGSRHLDDRPPASDPSAPATLSSEAERILVATDLDPVLEGDTRKRRWKLLVRKLARERHAEEFPLATRDVLVMLELTRRGDASAAIHDAVANGYLVTATGSDRIRGEAAWFRLSWPGPSSHDLTTERTQSTGGYVLLCGEFARFPYGHDAWSGAPNLWRLAMLVGRHGTRGVDPGSVAQDLGISRTTVKKALDTLREAGLVQRTGQRWCLTEWQLNELDRLREVRNEQRWTRAVRKGRRPRRIGPKVRPATQVTEERDAFRARNAVRDRQQKLARFARDKDREDAVSVDFDADAGWLTPHCGSCGGAVKEGTCLACGVGPIPRRPEGTLG